MFTHISRGPENDMSEIWSSSGRFPIWEKKFSQMDCNLDKAPQKCCLQDLMVQNVVEKQFLRQEGPTALKF